MSERYFIPNPSSWLQKNFYIVFLNCFINFKYRHIYVDVFLKICIYFYVFNPWVPKPVQDPVSSPYI